MTDPRVCPPAVDVAQDSKSRALPIVRRHLLAQVLVCTGGACQPSVAGPPVDVLKAAWKLHRLYGRVHLTFTGCLGRCDRPAQVLISHQQGTLAFAAVADASWWASLIDWAIACAVADRVLPPSPSMLPNLDQPWRGS